jgi:hypothetical protein
MLSLNRGYALLGVVALISIAFLGWELRSARAAARDNGFRADSVSAALDTTRAVNSRAAAVLGDSLRGVELRAVQLVNLKVDALDAALRRISATRFNTTSTIRSIDSLPAPPASGKIGISVRTDTARLSYRVQCGKAKADGIRPASVEISGPVWLSTTISAAQTEQNVCNAQQNPSHWLRWLLVGGSAGLAGGYALWH